MDLINISAEKSFGGCSFYSEKELQLLGINKLGDNVLISRKASLYNPDKLIIGNNVRIDDFCILSGQIKIGSFVHISAYCALYGKFGITIKDFSGVSPGGIIFSASDDFSGEYLINPMVPEEFTNVTGGPVILEKFVQIGSGSVVFPDLTIKTGAVIAALSLVNKNIDEWTIAGGVPAKFLKKRKKGLLQKYEILMRRNG